eukprot:jgi/Botrbrau1/4026/Bobra.0016s0033.1
MRRWVRIYCLAILQGMLLTQSQWSKHSANSAHACSTAVKHSHHVKSSRADIALAWICLLSHCLPRPLL